MSAHSMRHLAGLASLPSMGPQRLGSILAAHPADEAFQLLAAGRRLSAAAEPDSTRRLFDALRQQAAEVSIDRLWASCADHDVRVLDRDDPEYPDQLAADEAPPPVIFVRGALSTLHARRVSVVGTRNATAAGRATAFELGQGLAEHGVAVVSGLARGIDGAAHRGVRAADGRAVGVVANGLDVAYPRQNADIWRWVGEHGLLVSERPPGCSPEAWRFPLRNRIVAALCEVLVVVESRETGGSLITVLEATRRGIDVMAVPGSPRTRASNGTNQLLVDGAAPVTCVDDVLVALGLDHHRADPVRTPSVRHPSEHDALDGRLLWLLEQQSSTLDMLAVAAERSVGEVAMAVMRLEQDGMVLDSEGWWEPVGSRLGNPPVRSAGSEIEPS